MTPAQKPGTENVFRQLHNKVAELAAARFPEPTIIQERAIPPILAGKNVLNIAGTGLGKTESAMLPLFSKLVETEHKPIALLYITPLRALNRDMFDRLIWWCERLGLDAAVRHGDTSASERKLQTEYPPHVLITTPEQIQGMITGARLREHLKNIKYIVIDELHELVESKRGIQLTLALARLREFCGNPQMIALSATVGSPDVAARFIFGESDYVIVRADDVKAYSLKVESPYPAHKDRVLAEKLFIGDGVAARLRRIYEVMTSSGSVLAFTNTREAAEVLGSRLHNMDKALPAEVHHSSLSREVRVKTEKEFKTEQLRALIATSSLELGIDIGAIQTVLQYMSPRQVSKLVQRVGRSGHGVGRTSKGIIITAEADDTFESAIIARKALAGELEPLRPHHGSLDVLAHQIIGIANDQYRISPEKAYKIVRSAWPYHDMKYKEFEAVLKLLEQLRMAWSDETIRRGRKALEYYFENLSVIPDSHNYKVIDMATNTPVGSLDEAFVAEHNEPGSTFIVRGRPWKIVGSEGDKIFVEQGGEIESAVPAWEGELIPVPYEVAQEVAELQSWIAKQINEGTKQTDIVEKMKERYPVAGNAASKMIKLVQRQAVKWPVPDKKTILIESYSEYTVLHAPFGSAVNETLVRFITALLSAQYGAAIVSRNDPYRIIMRGCEAKDIKKLLLERKPEELQPILAATLPRTSLFRHRFLQVAKRFGAVRKGADLSQVNIGRIIDSWHGSPIISETLNELFVEKLDVEQTSEVLAAIQNGKIKFVECQGLSPFAELGLKYELHDIARPDRPEAEIFRLFKQRLMGTRVRLVCVNCGKYSVQKYVKDIEKEPRCSLCHSKLLAAVHPSATESQTIVQKRLAGKQLTTDELKKLERIRRSADLVIVYGRDALIVLSGRGVGPQTAARILARMHRTEEELYKDILHAEREFVRTHRFWSD